MKIVGIVADNYKLEFFKKELAAAEFEIESIKPFMKETSTIKVKTLASRIQELSRVCKKVEHHFKHAN